MRSHSPQVLLMLKPGADITAQLLAETWKSGLTTPYFQGTADANRAMTVGIETSFGGVIKLQERPDIRWSTKW